MLIFYNYPDFPDTNASFPRPIFPINTLFHCLLTMEFVYFKTNHITVTHKDMSVFVVLGVLFNHEYKISDEEDVAII